MMLLEIEDENEDHNMKDMTDDIHIVNKKEIS